MSAQTDTQSAMATLRRAYDASQRALVKTLEALRQMREMALAEAERSERLAGELRRADERITAMEARIERLTYEPWDEYGILKHHGLRRCRYCRVKSYDDGTAFWDEDAPLHEPGCIAGKE